MRKPLLHVVTSLAGLLATSAALAVAAPARADDVFVAPVAPVQGVASPTEADALSRAIESAVLKRVVDVDVITPRALDTKIELDLMRACTTGDDASCVVDFAQSMGVRYVLRPALGRIGDTSVLTLSLFDGRRAALLAQAQRAAPSTAALLDALPDLVAEVARGGGLSVVVERPRPTPYLQIAELTTGTALLAGSLATHLVAFFVVEPAYQSAALTREEAAAWELGRVPAYGLPFAGYLAGAALLALGIATWPEEEP